MGWQINMMMTMTTAMIKEDINEYGKLLNLLLSAALSAAAGVDPQMATVQLDLVKTPHLFCFLDLVDIFWWKS